MTFTLGLRQPRLEDWSERLGEFFTGVQSRAFERGKWDCALFACHAYEAMTGYNPGADFIGHYETADGAEEILKAYGFDQLIDAVKEFLGEPLRTPLLSQRGDAVVFETPDGPALGIVDLTGTHFLALTERKGLIRLPLRLAITAWRV
jgi:hypothetical protein